MDEIEQRLQTTSENCIKAYKSWSEARKGEQATEALQDAIHELRKVASRLEIEIAVSERSEVAGKPLPIPPHRAARNNPDNAGKGRRSVGGRGRQNDHSNNGDDDDNKGNNDGPSASDSNGDKTGPAIRKVRRRRPRTEGESGGDE